MSGSLPANLFTPKDLTAVETLQQNVSDTDRLLKKKKKPKAESVDRKFKGFKKKKQNKKKSE